jgi:hypothetical protein
MKKILTFLFCIGIWLLLLSLLTISCEDKGVTSLKLSGNEPTLPAELKGLKVYRVSCGDNEYVKVGILNNQVVSTTYQAGKVQQSVILVNKEVARTINVESIISENDSIIVIKKSK